MAYDKSMFNHCPSCASKSIKLTGNRFDCPDCGFVYFHNTSVGSGCLIVAEEKVLFLVRAKEPALGKLDLPGGFTDPGEGILEGLSRELREELGWEPPFKPGEPLRDHFKLLASFPNAYPYRGITYNVCDLFFVLMVQSLSEADLNLEAEEVSGCVFLRPQEINLEDLAFDSTRRAVKVYLDMPPEGRENI